MTFRAAAFCLSLLLSPPALAQQAGDVADRAQSASALLLAAIEGLEQAADGKEQVSALTRTIQAYESGLGDLREALRQVTIRETELVLRFDAKRDRVAQLLGVLVGMGTDPGPLLLLHPSGPLGSARSGMMMAEVTPALHA
ncbi:MAG: peptidase M23, partial [Gemmobacter sp.]|nr:peptidase M23 [Gemmobacter sp.]